MCLLREWIKAWQILFGCDVAISAGHRGLCVDVSKAKMLVWNVDDVIYDILEKLHADIDYTEYGGAFSEMNNASV